MLPAKESEQHTRLVATKLYVPPPLSPVSLSSPTPASQDKFRVLMPEPLMVRTIAPHGDAVLGLGGVRTGARRAAIARPHAPWGVGWGRDTSVLRSLRGPLSRVAGTTEDRHRVHDLHWGHAW